MRPIASRQRRARDSRGKLSASSVRSFMLVVTWSRMRVVYANLPSVVHEMAHLGCRARGRSPVGSDVILKALILKAPPTYGVRL
jgi:hypothetical protein